MSDEAPSFFEPVALDASAAAVIAAGMRAVARADGEVHHQELALIESFEEQIPKGTTPGPLHGDLGETYLRSLILVALADGRISEEEHQVIVNLAAGQGIDADAVQAEVDVVKRYFLSRFAGVTVFQEAVTEIAASLGLDG